jgi:signal transduction histidine kinase
MAPLYRVGLVMSDGQKAPNSTDEVLLSHLQSLLERQARREDLLRSEGRSYVLAFGIALRRQSGQPWYKQLAVVRSFPGSLSQKIQREVVDRLLNAEGDQFGEYPLANEGYSIKFTSEEHESLLICYQRLDTGVEAIPSVGAWCIATRSSTTGFLPTSLRSLSHRARYILRRDLLRLPPHSVIVEAGAANIPEDILAACAHICGASGAILWFFDSTEHEYQSLATWGVKEARHFRLPVNRPTAGMDIQRGIVSLVRPEVRYVLYDLEDSTEWRPRRPPGRWFPRDEGVFRVNGWRSCLAYPVISDGYLVGCISLYSAQSGYSLRAKAERLPLDLVGSVLQGFLRAHEESSRIADIEKSFDEEFSRSVVSLAVLGIAHDISTDARTLSGLIKDTLPTQLSALTIEHGVEDALKQARRAVDRLLDVTTHMKTIARDRPAGESNVNIREVLESLQPLLEAQVKQASERRASVTVIAPAAPRGYSYVIRADPVKLERVILNLVDNAGVWAAQSSQRGKVVVKASPAAIDEQGTEGVLISVEDNGPGIDPSIRPRIFSRFFTTRKGSGTGLGLYLAHRFVAEMRGRINVESRPGRTVFSVIVPPMT